MNLSQLGFNPCMKDQANEVCTAEQSVARVTAVDRDRYMVRNELKEIPAKLTGKLMYTAESPIDLPCIGDWVCVQYHDTESFATIHSTLTRDSFLRRKSAGKDIDFQMIAANIDVALIVQACHFDFNIRRLERYLVMVNEGHIEPLVILTKIDLVSPDELEQLIRNIRRAGINSKIIALSNVTGDGISQIREIMTSGKTYCLIGSSGVGKTTLINQLTGSATLETKTVSGTGEGRHTTVRRQLIILEQGAMLIDTPGMRELGILAAESGIDNSFSDIQSLSQSCRFADCSHTNEPGCAILKALENGDLDQEHYSSYLKLKKESEFYEMSYAEKRKKDKAFGKFVHSAIKHKEKNK